VKGILFKPDMVKAIAEGRKTVTRRVIPLKGYSPNIYARCLSHNGSNAALLGEPYLRVPFDEETYKMGARLTARYKSGETAYVKEAWCRKADPVTARAIEGEYWYQSTNPEVVKLDEDGGIKLTRKGYLASPWQSPRFMPEDAARYFITITGVRAERLQGITNEDAITEGIMPPEHAFVMVGNDVDAAISPREEYAELWDTINPKYPWDSNPWVWVYQFQLRGRPTDE